VFGDVLQGQDQLILEEYLEEIDLEAVDQAAVDQD